MQRANTPTVAAPGPLARAGEAWRAFTTTSPAELRRWLEAHAEAHADADTPPAREAGGPSLGLRHGVLHELPPPPTWALGDRLPAELARPDRTRRRNAPAIDAWSRRPWAADLADLDVIPVLSSWGRRRVAARLADRPGTSPDTQTGELQDRMWKCATGIRRRADASPQMFRTSSGKWSWSSVVRCKEWCCPSCGPARAAKGSQQLHSLLSRWLAGDRSGLTAPDAWMLTVTVPHHFYDDPGVTVGNLYDAWAAFVRSSAWRRFRARWGISSVVRALDATFGGGSGPHPHFHVALLPSASACVGLDQEARVAQLAELERDLREAWRDAVEDWTGCRPSSVACLRLTPGEDAASYFTAWGMSSEVTQSPVKARSHLRLLDAAGAGDDEAGAEFQSWREATRGRAWLSGLTDALRRQGITADDVAADHRERQHERDAIRDALVVLGRAEPLPVFRELSLVVPSYLWPAAVAMGLEDVEAIADRADAAGADPQAWVLDSLHLRWQTMVARGRPPP